MDEGGEAACWLDRVCEECGRLRERSAPEPCENCGTPARAAAIPRTATPAATTADPAAEPGADRPG